VSGSLRNSWTYFVSELWVPLAEYSAYDAVAPPDLFSDLFVAADEYLSPRPTRAELEEARNNTDKARQRFLALTGTDFTSESDIVLFLEESNNVISDYEILGFESTYKRLLRGTLRKFNLRYRLDDPFTLRFMLPGSFANLYAELQKVNSFDSSLDARLEDFEKAFDRFARTQDSTDLRHCIHMASNYVEGLASVTSGIPATGNTLGNLVKGLTDWPHDKIREALVNLYHFCSDYPGIRHPGHPASARRALAIRDGTMACLLLLSFVGYLSPNFDERAVLGV
jgi:hypothetical protein